MSTKKIPEKSLEDTESIYALGGQSEDHLLRQNKLPTWLKEKREEKGLTQEEVGKVLGQGKANISKYETGQIPYPPLENLYKICMRLGVSIADALVAAGLLMKKGEGFDVESIMLWYSALPAEYQKLATNQVEQIWLLFGNRDGNEDEDSGSSEIIPGGDVQTGSKSAAKTRQDAQKDKKKSSTKRR